jgi:hypothetical protein
MDILLQKLYFSNINTFENIIYIYIAKKIEFKYIYSKYKVLLFSKKLKF